MMKTKFIEAHLKAGKTVRRQGTDIAILRYLLLSILIVGLSGQALAQVISIDHAIYLSEDIDKAISEFGQMGFTIKPGRKHQNGLINAHIKFWNNSSFELMSLQGTPNDEIASKYETLLKNNIKGAYLAFTGSDQDEIEKALKSIEIEYQVSSTALWTYITFADHTDLEHIFFIFYKTNQESNTHFTSHDNGINGIKSISIEGSQKLIELLDHLNLDKTIHTDGSYAYSTPTGDIIIMPLSHTNRPKLLEVSFASDSADNSLRISLDQ